MGSKLKKSRSISLVLGSVLILMMAVSMTAYAENASKLAEKINEFKHGGSGTLTASAFGNTVTVTGKVTNATNSFRPHIDEDVTIVWNADFSGSGPILVYLGGDGIFEIPAGGSVTNTSGIAVSLGKTVKVTGGTVRSSGGSAITTGYGNYVIEITDGIVESDSSHAISAQHSKIDVSGGTVVSTKSIGISNLGDGAITTVSGGTVRAATVAVDSGLDGSLVLVTGGVVESTGGSCAISGKDISVTGGIIKNTSQKTGTVANGIRVSGNLVVNGGTVSADDGYVIVTSGTNATITIEDGFLFAYGKSIVVDDIFARGGFAIENSGGLNTTTIGGSAVVCAWNKDAGVATYAEGTADGLTVSPSGASATWGINGNDCGIKYVNGENTGFFPISGITVTPKNGETVVPTESDDTPVIESLSIMLNGNKVTTETPPFVDSNDRTMVPVRFISEALGAEVAWNDDAQLVTVIKESTVIELTIDSNQIITNGIAATMDTAAIIKDERTFVPVRFIAEALQLKVGWEEATSTVVLTTAAN